MTYWETISAQLIGTTAGFLFSAVLFFITFNWQRWYAKRKLFDYLIKELEHDVALLHTFKDGLSNVKSRVSSGSRNTFEVISFGKFQQGIILKCWSEGYLYEKFGHKDIGVLDGILRRYNLNEELYINGKIIAFRDSKIDSAPFIDELIFREGQMIDDIEKLKELINKAR